tara:strand:+ start:356 stop:1270 length:915 start_codon:yes stop_codon:yes gene_type:complete
MIKKKIYLILFILFLNLNAESKITIIKKVNNQIITNLDIDIEEKYLKTLNPKIKNLDPIDFRRIALESLVNEKIKKIELERFFIIDHNELPKDVFISFIKKFNVADEDEFKKFLRSNNLKLEMVKKKIYMEFLWNSLIYNKYGAGIKIDENKIKNKVLEISKKVKEKKFLLYELIYNIDDVKNLENKTSKIKQSIKDIGFEGTVSIYSISETAKVGGKIGWINEGQVSNIIYKELKDLKKGEITDPLKTLNGYMLLMAKDIKYSEKKIDIEKETKKLIDYETNEKLKNFSLLHFNKVKINQQIN